MSYEELLEKKEKLENELKEVQQNINNHEDTKFLEHLDTAIIALRKAVNLKPYVSVSLDYECERCGYEDCEMTTLADIAYVLTNLTESMK